MGFGEAGADTGGPDELSCRRHALAERVAGMATVNLAGASDMQRNGLISGFVRATVMSSQP
jgi:hypothetical protein